MELVGLIVWYGITATLRCYTQLSRILLGCRLCCRSQCVDEVSALNVEGGGGEELKTGDVAAVMARLGMACKKEEEGMGEGKLMVGELLEEKEASEWELKEAFYVFDRNEDGFITPEELWNVMRRLGFEEGRRVEDCERMIRVFDEDGDGRINFQEFRKLLENTM